MYVFCLCVSVVFVCFRFVSFGFVDLLVVVCLRVCVFVGLCLRIFQFMCLWSYEFVGLSVFISVLFVDIYSMCTYNNWLVFAYVFVCIHVYSHVYSNVFSASSKSRK